MERQCILNCKGKVWIRYDDSSKVQDAKLDSAAIGKHVELLTVLHGVQGNLSFKKTTVTNLIQMVIDEFAEGWGLADQHLEDYKHTITRRFCNMCRHVGQAVCKDRPPKWTETLPWMQALPSSAPPIATVTEYTYGYITELQVAYRRKVPAGRQELSLPIHIEDDAEDIDAPTAKWADGDVWRVSSITCGQLRKVAASGVVKTETVYEGTHLKTKHAIIVKRLTDRETVQYEGKMLMTLFEQGRNQCSIHFRKFRKSLDELPDGEEAEERAAAFMTKLAQLFEKDLVNVSGLKQKRNDLFNEENEKEQYMKPPKIIRPVGEKAPGRQTMSSKPSKKAEEATLENAQCDLPTVTLASSAVPSNKSQTSRASFENDAETNNKIAFKSFEYSLETNPTTPHPFIWTDPHRPIETM